MNYSPSRFLHSRLAPFAAGALAVAWTVVLGPSAPVPAGCAGLLPAWSGPWLASYPALDMALALTLNIALAGAVAWMCSYFNLLRSISRLASTSLLVMQMAVPSMLAHVAGPTVVAAALVACMSLMFSVYAWAGPLGARRVMLAFFILSLGAAAAWPCLVFIPVLALACAQMRALTPRTLMAAAMGLAAPWVIIMGLGLAAPADVRWPWGSASLPSMGTPAAAAAALTAFAALAFWLLNLMKYLTYNARSRAMLSVVTTVTLAAIAAAAIDYRDCAALLPALALCAALQMGHLFGVIYTRRRSWVAILLCWLPFLLTGLWSALPRP